MTSFGPRSDPNTRISIHKEPNSNNHSHHSSVDYGRLSQRTTAAAAAAAAAIAAVEVVPRPSVTREQPVDVKINDIVGNGVSGILYKWVNYGKGWRPRWFVLQDGVLSYFKIHGPDRIIVTPETEKGSKVIGETSMRRLLRHRNANPQQLRRKPFGEVHLKVFNPFPFSNSFSLLFHFLYYVVSVP